jgi:hypothetical protein
MIETLDLRQIPLYGMIGNPLLLLKLVEPPQSFDDLSQTSQTPGFNI